MTTLCTKLYHTVLTWFGQKWSGEAEGRGHFSHAPTVSTYIFLYNSYLSRSIVDTYMQLIIALFMAGKLVKHNLMVKRLCGVFRVFHGYILLIGMKNQFLNYNFEFSWTFWAIRTSLVCLLFISLKPIWFAKSKFIILCWILWTDQNSKISRNIF